MKPDQTDATGDLTGQCLIAMPGMGDPRFAHSVVYLCAHSDEGAMGLIVNKPQEEVTLRELLDQLELPGNETGGNEIGGNETGGAAGTTPRPIYFGGPVETGRGFVLHSSDYRSPVATLEVSPELFMTATMDVLEEIATQSGPSKALVALGYAGWGPGQLEAEIAQNGWLTCPGNAKLIFETPDFQKWESALESIGVPALALSAEAGHA